MWESNVAGVMRVTKALLPALRRRHGPHIVIVGSVAGVEVYEGGGGYTAAKHAAHAIAQTLRIELLGDAIRVTEVAPGPGRDRVLAGPLRGRQRARRRGLPRARAAARRRRRRADRLLRDPSPARRHRLRDDQADRPGDREDRQPQRLSARRPYHPRPMRIDELLANPEPGLLGRVLPAEDPDRASSCCSRPSRR